MPPDTSSIPTHHLEKTMKLPKILVAGVVGTSVLLGTVACSPAASSRVSGVVVEKDADAAKKSCKTKTVNGKKRKSCTTKRADYDITVKDAQGKEHEIEVSRSEFDRIQIGQRYTSK